jgi:hypothetical protein
MLLHAPVVNAMTDPVDSQPEADAPQPTNFVRGGAGPPQPLPKGANVALVLVSLLMLACMMGILGWLLL